MPKEGHCLLCNCTDLSVSLSQNRNTWRKLIVARPGSECVEDGDGDCEVAFGACFLPGGKRTRNSCFPSRSLNICRETRHLEAEEVEIPQQTSEGVVEGVGKEGAHQKRRNTVTDKTRLPCGLLAGIESPLVGHWNSEKVFAGNRHDSSRDIHLL